MTADEARELFGEVIDESLDAERRADFDAIVAADDDLRADFEAYRSIVRGVHAVLPRVALRPGDRGVRMPTDMASRVQARIRGKGHSRSFQERFEAATGRGQVTILTLLTVFLLIVGTIIALAQLDLLG